MAFSTGTIRAGYLSTNQKTIWGKPLEWPEAIFQACGLCCQITPSFCCKVLEVMDEISRTVRSRLVNIGTSGMCCQPRTGMFYAPRAPAEMATLKGGISSGAVLLSAVNVTLQSYKRGWVTCWQLPVKTAGCAVQVGLKRVCGHKMISLPFGDSKWQ